MRSSRSILLLGILVALNPQVNISWQLCCRTVISSTYWMVVLHQTDRTSPGLRPQNNRPHFMFSHIICNDVAALTENQPLLPTSKGKCIIKKTPVCFMDMPAGNYAKTVPKSDNFLKLKIILYPMWHLVNVDTWDMGPLQWLNPKIWKCKLER